MMAGHPGAIGVGDLIVDPGEGASRGLVDEGASLPVQVTPSTHQARSGQAFDLLSIWRYMILASIGPRASTQIVPAPPACASRAFPCTPSAPRARPGTSVPSPLAAQTTTMGPSVPGSLTVGRYPRDRTGSGPRSSGSRPAGAMSPRGCPAGSRPDRGHYGRAAHRRSRHAGSSRYFVKITQRQQRSIHAVRPGARTAVRPPVA